MKLTIPRSRAWSGRKHRNQKNRLTALAAAALAAGALTACGASGEYTEAGMRLIGERGYAEALAAFDGAEEAGENERLIARGRGIALMGQTRYEEAIEYFEEALRKSDGFLEPVDYDLSYYRAAALMKLERYAEAEEAYSAILALDDQEDAHFLRGIARLRLDEFLAAREDFDRAVAMDAGNYDRIIEIYQALAECGYREAGMEYLGGALEGASSSKMSALDRGRIYYYMGDYQQAATQLEDARANVGDASSSLFLGMAYEAMGEYNYAANVYESYLAKDEGSAAIYNQLGLCRLETGDYRSALENFELGMQTGEASVMQSLLFNEIVAYEYLGDYRSASVLIEDYLRQYPDDKEAQRESIFLSTR